MKSAPSHRVGKHFLVKLSFYRLIIFTNKLESVLRENTPYRYKVLRTMNKICPKHKKEYFPEILTGLWKSLSEVFGISKLCEENREKISFL